MAIVLSVVVHLVVIALVVVSFQWTPSISTPQSQPIIQAVAVDETKVKEEARKLKKAEDDRKAAEERRKRAAEQAARKAREQRLAEEKRLADLKQKRAQEEQQRKLAEQKRKEEETQRVAAQKAEQQRLEKLRQEREAEEKRLADLEAKRKLEEEQRRQQEAERQRREEEERIRQEQIAAENARLEQERQALASRTIDKYTALIRTKVQNNWLQPTGSRKELRCEVSIRLLPSGDVVGVQIVSSSGDPIFDRSVEVAVQKASPLPVPGDGFIFDQMREITFIFDPSKG